MGTVERFDPFLAPCHEESLHFAGLPRHIPAQCNSAGLLDLEDGWRAKLGMSAEGAVLVRPDGFVGWRTSTLPASPERRFEQVISSILCRSRVGPPLRPATAEARPLR